MLQVSSLYAKWEQKIATAAATHLKKPDFLGLEETPVSHHHHHHHEDVSPSDDQDGNIPSSISSPASMTHSTPTVPPSIPSSSSRFPYLSRRKRRDNNEERHSFWREYSFGILSFTVVIREGMESVLFLTGVGQNDPLSLLIPGIVGVILGLLIGYLIWRGAAKMRLDLFFRISAIVLLIVAAGLAANAAASFESYNVSRILSDLGAHIVLDTT